MNTRDNARVLTLQTGGLGDLVLTSELIGSLKSHHPEWTVVLACRAELEAIAGLFPIPPDEVIGLPLNPYFNRQPSDELRRVLESVVHRFDGRIFSSMARSVRRGSPGSWPRCCSLA